MRSLRTTWLLLFCGCLAISCFDSRRRAERLDSSFRDSNLAVEGTGGFSTVDESIGSGGSDSNYRDGETAGVVTSGGADGSDALDQRDASRTGGSGSAGSEGGNRESDSGVTLTDSGLVGLCCPDGYCLCHGPDPTELTSDNGPHDIAELQLEDLTVSYPIDAEPPFATLVFVPGFASIDPPLLSAWASFFASWDVVSAHVSDNSSFLPENRVSEILDAIEAVKAENTDPNSPLFEKISDRYGIAGNSLAGTACWFAASQNDSLKTSMAMAGVQVNSDQLLIVSEIRVPSLILSGSADIMANDSGQSVYDAIPESTPKLLLEITGAQHNSWFGPKEAGSGASGSYALAFQKVFLEGDQRWKPLLLVEPKVASDWRTNIE